MKWISQQLLAYAVVMSQRNAARSREAILQAARNLFGARGFERTSVRAIAAKSGLDGAMVMRYFGSKEHLFAQAMAFDLHLPAAGSIPPTQLGQGLVRHFLLTWENNEELQVMLRSAVTNEAATERLREIFSSQVLAMVREIPTPTGIATAEQDAVLRAGLVASQILGFALTRYVLQFDGVKDLSTDDAVAWLAPTLQRYLTGEIPAL